MTLPHETEVLMEIAAKHRVQLDAMTKLHDAVVAMMSAGSWTIQNKRGLNPVVVQTMIGLLTKASKTFRAIQVLCERGLQDDANALVRVLMETTVAIAFILQKKSKERTLIYHAHGIAQNIKMDQRAHLRRNIRLCVTPYPTTSCMAIKKRADSACLI